MADKQETKVQWEMPVQAAINLFQVFQRIDPIGLSLGGYKQGLANAIRKVQTSAKQKRK